jgi:CRISPR-associated endoribonuclease Cas6
MPGGKRRFTKEGFSGERFIFFISSFNKSLLSKIRESLEESGHIVIFNNKFQIHSMLFRDVNPSSEIITIHSRSPIILKNGQKYLFNEPEEVVLRAIDSNIRSKYIKANGRDPNIRFIQIQDIKTKKVGIKGVKLPGFLINFTISADLDVLSFILTVGLGSKNKLGFGFVEEEKAGDFHGY